MALEIYWTKKADKSFSGIVDYLESKWGEKSVIIFIRKTYLMLDLLSEFPEIGTIEFKSLNIRGLLLVRQIRLFYQIRDKKIILLNFYDNRQNPQKRKY